MNGKKLFEGIPDSFLMGIIPFAYLFFYLYYISLKGTFLSIYEFYSLNLLPLLFIVSIRGSAFFDAIGLDLDNAPIHIVIGRLLILVFVGIVFGFSVYKFFNLLGMQLFPFDFFYLQLTTANPFMLSIIDTGIVAFFEEVIRVVPMLIFINAFYKKGFKEGDSIIYGVFLSSFLFILMHFFAWSGLNMMNVLVMTTTVIFMTLSGWLLYHRQLWGPLTFVEFSLISPMAFHFTYDISINLSLRVLSILPMALGLI